MNKAEAAGEKPSAANPLPTIGGTPGMQLLRKQIMHGPKRPQLPPEEQAEVARAAAALSTSLSPPSPSEIADMVDRLAWHHPRTARPENARRAVAEDWLADLAHRPADIIDAACAAWRRAPNVYAPTPRHLLALATPILEARRFLSRLATQLAAEAGPGKVAEPAPQRHPREDRA
jgi:hypothetical protein